MTAKDRIKGLQGLIGAAQDGSIGKETLSKFAAKYGKTRAQTVQFFAQIHHESGGFTLERENMAYSAARIMQIFGVGRHSARVTEPESRQLAGKPKQLAERVYGLGNPSKAKELGNTRPGDGYLFRGGGAIQITGGAAFKQFGGQYLYDNPDKVGEPEYYFVTALRYFDARGIWALAYDLSDTSIEAVTRRINGGYNGLADRKAKTAYYASLWPVSDIPKSIGEPVRTTANLNLRSGAGTSYNVLSVLPKDTVVEVTETAGAWSKVKVVTNVGWVNNTYLK